MNEDSENSPAPELAVPSRGEGWSFTRWLAVIALVFATQAALIFLFGEKKEAGPRAVKNVSTLKLADHADERLALDDPTLFALPNANDFASATWLKMPDVKPPSFRWTEPPQPLPLPAGELGAVFGRLMQTDLFTSRPFNFKPVPKLSTPALPVEPALAQNSTMQIEGELAQRQLPSEISLTNWPYADVLAPCVVQVLVDAAGSVISTVLLTPSGYDAADQRALELARNLRFTPSSSLAFGRIVFNWHTVPPIASP
jgi:TonB family protein